MAPLIQGLVKPDFEWTDRLPVWVVPDIATYNQIGSGADAHSYYLRIYATHSVVHQFIDRACPNTRAKVWVQERLAACFSLYWNWQWGASELSRFKQRKTQIPIRTLLTRSVGTMGSNMHQHCIELGMFFNYLLHYREDAKSTTNANKVQAGPFADYLRQALAGKRTTDHAMNKLIFRSVKEVEAGFRAQKFQ